MAGPGRVTGHGKWFCHTFRDAGVAVLKCSVVMPAAQRELINTEHRHPAGRWIRSARTRRSSVDRLTSMHNLAASRDPARPARANATATATRAPFRPMLQRACARSTPEPARRRCMRRRRRGRRRTGALDDSALDDLSGFVEAQSTWGAAAPPHRPRPCGVESGGRRPSAAAASPTWLPPAWTRAPGRAADWTGRVQRSPHRD